MADLTTLLSKFLENLYEGVFGSDVPITEITITETALGTTPDGGQTLINTTDAAAGAQQVSPPVIWQGEGWKTDATAASQPVTFRAYVLPVQGTSAPTANWLLQSNINGGAYSTVGTVSSAGLFTAGNAMSSPGALTFSASATASEVRGTAGIVRLGLTSGVIGLTDENRSALSTVQYGLAGAATTSVRLQKKITGIADATATDVLTVTVPNAAHACAIRLWLLSSNGSTDAFESSRCAEGGVVLARTAGVDTVAAVAALTLAQIATVASGATHTLAYDLSAISGLSSATQTFTIRVTINDSGNTGSNQLVVLAELLNAEATGVTIA